MARADRVLRTDGEVTRTRILQAAGELFAATGFAETTSKQIAATAVVDVASINYHFGSRSGLYRAVLVEAHRRLISGDVLRQLAATDMAAKDKLRKIIEIAVEAALGRHGWHSTVLIRELLSPSSHLDFLQRTEVIPKLDVFLEIFSEITSIPAGDPALLRCLISVVAPCSLLLVTRQSHSLITAEIFDSPRDALVEHLYRFSVGGLEAVARDHKIRDAP